MRSTGGGGTGGGTPSTTTTTSTTSTTSTISTSGGGSTSDDQSRDSRSVCAGEMGFLFKVYPKQIRAMSDQVVHISPVCENQSLTVSQNVGSLLREGNVMGMRAIIGQNELLTSVLDDKDYAADDVVGIRVNRNSNEVILYVHKSGI